MAYRLPSVAKFSTPGFVFFVSFVVNPYPPASPRPRSIRAIASAENSGAFLP